MPHEPSPSDVIGACLGFYVLFIITVLRRNGLLDAHVWESYFDGMGLYPVSGMIQGYAITFSFSSRRQKAELAKFIGELKEVERLVQRYEYLAGTHDALKLESNGHAFNEGQTCLSAEATKELESLPWQVYEKVQAVENYRQAKRDNVWIRRYVSRFWDGFYWTHDREECARRLGCCAASCGCCDKRRGNGAVPDDAPAGQFMRIARTYLGDHTHCSIDCECCIRRRNFSLESAS